MTIFTNLAVAVFCGIIFTALNFAWTEGKQIGFVGDDQDGLTAGDDADKEALTEAEQAAKDLLGFNWAPKLQHPESLLRFRTIHPSFRAGVRKSIPLQKTAL